MNEKRLLKNFSFLINNYNFIYKVHIFSSYKGFLGPMILYTFHNENGCFTIFHAVQRNEIDYYYSFIYSNSINDLTKNEISFKEIRKNKYSRKIDCILFEIDDLKLLARYIKKQIENEDSFFGIKI